MAIRVQLGKWLSLIPGWAGFAAPRPELGVEQKGARRSPLFYSCRFCRADRAESLFAYFLRYDLGSAVA